MRSIANAVLVALLLVSDLKISSVTSFSIAILPSGFTSTTASSRQGRPFPLNKSHHLIQSTYGSALDASSSSESLESGDENGDVAGSADDDTSNKNTLPQLSRRTRLKRKLKRVLAISIAAASARFAAPVRPANAIYSYEITSNPDRPKSIRPGVSSNQAEQLVDGKMPEELQGSSKSSLLDGSSSSSANESGDTASTSTRKRRFGRGNRAERRNKKATSTFDYGDDEDEEFAAEDLAMSEQDKLVSGNSASGGSSNSAFESKKFSFNGEVSSKGTSQTTKVAVAMFIPTFGAMMVREAVRQRKEEKYVQKGLEILEAQKAEYFGVNTTADDADIEDELKDLKDEDEDDEDDEDEDEDYDDEDEDDEDEDEDDGRLSSRPGANPKPKKPSGGGGSDGGNAGGGSSSSGPPSEEDIKRLGDLFNKS